MNYPVWYLPETGGGLLIALIAVTHVFVSHFAVGGGLYLVLTERLGLREQNPEILDYTRRHTRFFMLLTMVFGGMTGVGIWFIIGLVQPAGASLLIHNFVYGWASEWVWFLVEIAALLIYYYTFGRMDDRTHQTIGWIYFAAAWLSLFLINGIIGFMLTPGAWVDNTNFWSGFFNPSFWPSLFLRSFIAFLLAGLYAFVTTSFLDNPALKARLTRYNGTWVISSLLLALPCAWWYLTILPEPARALVAGASPTIRTAGQVALYALIALILLVLATIIRPAVNTRAVALVTLIPAFLLMGAFEWTREAARRPFVVNSIMYSPGIFAQAAAAMPGQSFLAAAKWAAVREVDSADPTRAGAELFKFQCYACHTIGGINNSILPRTASMDVPALTNYILKIMPNRPYMPPFVGSDEEAAALAAYIVGDLHGKAVTPATPPSPTAGGTGPAILEQNCTGCHDVDVIIAWAQGKERAEIATGLADLQKLNPMMEGVSLSDAEQETVVAWLHAGKTGGEK